MSHKHQMHLTLFGKYLIPDKYLRKSFTHSHGHGGQNVNKVSTKVHLKVFTDDLPLPEEYLMHLREKYPHGHAEVTCQDTRHQHENLEIAFHKLQQELEGAVR